MKTHTVIKPEVDLYGLDGKVLGKVVLPEEIFATSANPLLLAQAVRVYQANQRAGTHATKTRSQVTGTTKKMYKQKGTGRARHGAAKAPIFVGGGVAHGPHPRDYTLRLSVQMKKKALYVALSEKVASGNVIAVKGMMDVTGKTKEVYSALKNMNIAGSKNDKTVLILLPSYSENLVKAGRNIHNLVLSQVNTVNALDVMKARKLILTEESIGKFATEGDVKAPTEKEVKEPKTKKVLKTK